MIRSTPTRYIRSSVTPIRVIRSSLTPTRVITSPIRVVVRTRPSILNREIKRIESRALTHPHYYATESYLNSSEARVSFFYMDLIVHVYHINSTNFVKKNSLNVIGINLYLLFLLQQSFDDITRDIRNASNALLRKVHTRVERAHSISPVSYASKYVEFCEKNMLLLWYLYGIFGVHKFCLDMNRNTDPIHLSPDC